MRDLNLAKQTQAPDFLSLAERYTTLRKVSAINGGEYAGACPIPGCTCTHDGFRVQPYASPEPRYLCRHCTDGKWRDIIDFQSRVTGANFKEVLNQLFGAEVTVATPEQIARVKAEIAQRQVEREQSEQAKQKEKRIELDQSQAWITYYENLDKLGKRSLWRARGLSDFWQDVFKVGYCPDRTFYSGDNSFHSDSLTIPTLRPKPEFHKDGYHPHECQALAHRLLAPADPGDKYRPHLAGCGKPLFWTDHECPVVLSPVLIVEGEIKAAVTWAYWNDYLYEKCLGWRGILKLLQVVGLPGKGFKQEWVAEFAGVDQIWICLDPDATKEANEIARLLGVNRCRIFDLPDKIDDMLISGTLKPADLAALFTTTRSEK